MRYLGIDFGLSNVGFAISEEGILAQPFSQFHYKKESDLIAKILEICKTQQIDRIVMGIPDGKIELIINDFIKQLKKNTNIPIVLEDETLSSYQARKILLNSKAPLKKRRNKEHQTAAAVILQNYLDNLNDSLL